MKKINLRGISEILSEKELKNVMGGSGTYLTFCETDQTCWTIFGHCSSCQTGSMGKACWVPYTNGC